MTARRVTETKREVSAGCLDCGRPGALWSGGNAQAVAARHHDATGHRTWVNAYMAIRYGAAPDTSDQHDIEDAIAASSSGGEPEGAPLTVSDAPAVPAAGVSAPTGRSVETSGQMPGGARGRKPEMTT
ncbi:hypothetical protein GGR88_001370 [Sphingomonas jejuensis]|uniref:Uncharacterized protein n=1 Tax=Sphingomonas jejuensis TaxID=904715 RepID=A0ABX0XKL0_9SPHN|nr:hypothetical protein [Sphingomonas jejuensis]NJC33896.1 hypothetical protein [Sphingomonas jejuensis]